MPERAEMKFKRGISGSTDRDVLYRPDPGPGPIPEPDPPDPAPDPFPTPPIPPEQPVSGAQFDHLAGGVLCRSMAYALLLIEQA
jgi:hypothetical protein